MQKSVVQLKKYGSTEVVDAELYDDITDEHVEMWRSTWKPEAIRLEAELTAKKVPIDQLPQDIRWEWDAKANWNRNLLAFQRYALVCDGKLQGLFLANLSKVGKIPAQVGKDLVYIEFVAKAPWNRECFGNKPVFGGIGTIFMRTAITISIAETFRGRLGLHSLPQSEKFYRDCGMTDHGVDTHKENLVYFEMTEDQAQSYLTKKT